eukprot:9182191-Alexandrium_andersonii.AAC.1
MSRTYMSMSSLVHVPLGDITVVQAMSACHPLVLWVMNHWNDHGMAGTSRQRRIHGVPQSTSVAAVTQA